MIIADGLDVSRICYPRPDSKGCASYSTLGQVVLQTCESPEAAETAAKAYAVANRCRFVSLPTQAQPLVVSSEVSTEHLTPRSAQHLLSQPEGSKSDHIGVLSTFLALDRVTHEVFPGHPGLREQMREKVAILAGSGCTVILDSQSKA